MDWKFVRKILTFVLAWLMVNPSGLPSGFAKDNPADDTVRTSAVKAAILKLGVGKDSRVMLSLEDSQRFTGYVTAAQEEGFFVGDVCTDQAAHVIYDQVTGLRGLNVATGAKVSVGPKPKGTPKLSADPVCGGAVARVKGDRTRTAVSIGAFALLGTFVVLIVIGLVAMHNAH